MNKKSNIMYLITYADDRTFALLLLLFQRSISSVVRPQTFRPTAKV